MPITVAPGLGQRPGELPLVSGKNGSTNTTFMPGMVAPEPKRPVTSVSQRLATTRH